VAAIGALKAAIASGSVETLLILDGNPVYNAPADLRFGDALAEVPVSIHLSLYDDETSQRCTWHLPQAHGLESWGDGSAWDGTLTMRQPLIAPLYDGRSDIEVLALVSGSKTTSGYELVRESLRGSAATADFEGFWRRALHDGTVEGTAWNAVQPRLAPSRLAVAVDGLRALLDAGLPNAERPEVVLAADSRVWDGRFANNGWLQELPDPLTKVTWDNALLVSPATARELGISDGEIAAIEARGRRYRGRRPSCLPGQARSSMTLALGYGRTAAGHVGDGVGTDAYPLRTTMGAVRGIRRNRAGNRPPIQTGHHPGPLRDRYALDSKSAIAGS